MFYPNKNLVLFTIVFLIGIQQITARPSFRVKRVSDQTLAEIETLLGLQSMKEHVPNVPVMYGRMVNPHRIPAFIYRQQLEMYQQQFEFQQRQRNKRLRQR